MNQSVVTSFQVSDGVGRALEISLRGVDELLPKDEWAKKQNCINIQFIILLKHFL